MATVTLTGGDKLQARLNQIASRLGRGGSVSVGFLEGARYPVRRQSAKSKRKAGRKQAVALHVAQVAFWNEFGTVRTPVRPFFRQTIKAKSPEWGDDMAKIAKATDYNAPQILALMGERIQGQIQASITAFTTPPNAPSTIARKGFDKPLIDTGTMQRMVDYRVTNA